MGLFGKSSKYKVHTKIVYAYVCGDILHLGHILALENAKSLGDKLIVGVLTDEAIMEKKSKPTMSFYERVFLVKSLKFVDCVVTQNKYSPLDNVKIIRPDVLIESNSHKEMPANEFVESYRGRVIVLPYFPNISSSGIKKKIERDI